MSFNPYDEETEKLRNNPDLVSISQAVRFLKFGVSPLCYEEEEALADVYCLSSFGSSTDWTKILRVLRSGLLTVTGIVEAGVYSDKSYYSDPEVNQKDGRWCDFVVSLTPDYKLGDKTIDIGYERRTINRIDPVLFSAKFANEELNEIGSAIVERQDELYFYRWAIVDHLCVQKSELETFSLEHRDNPFSNRSASEANDSEKVLMDKQINPKKLTSYEKMIAAMSFGGYKYDPRDKKSHVPKEITDDAAKLGLSISSETVKTHLDTSIEASGAVLPEKE